MPMRHPPPLPPPTHGPALFSPSSHLQEDALLVDAVQRYGARNWSLIAQVNFRPHPVAAAFLALEQPPNQLSPCPPPPPLPPQSLNLEERSGKSCRLR